MIPWLWIKLETTGLDPHYGRVLEYAAAITDESLDVLAQCSAVLRATDADIAPLRVSERVVTMHTATGLWEECAVAPCTLAEADTQLASIASDLSGGRQHRVMIAGCTPAFEISWVRAHFLRLAPWVSHRALDVTSVRAAVEAWLGPREWTLRPQHRAMPDLLCTIADARIARAAMIGGLL